MIDAGGVAQMKPGAVVLNYLPRAEWSTRPRCWRRFASGQLSRYVCDFPAAHLHGQPGVILLPHLGASTGEAEENSAAMVAEQVRDYLIDGTIHNSVNFPDVFLPRESDWRVAIANAERAQHGGRDLPRVWPRPVSTSPP